MRLLRFLAAFMGLQPAMAIAQVIPQTPSSISGCGVAPGLPCASGGAAGAATLILTLIIPAAQYIFYAIAIGFFFYYGVRLMLESEDESTITETKSAYGYAIAGCVMVSVAGLIVQSVGPGFASSTLVNDAPISTGISNVILFMRLMVSTAVTVMVVFQGFRLILLQGQDAEIEKQKKRFFYSLLGVVVVLLANVIVTAFVPDGGTGSSGLAVQIVGITNFLLQILGALAVLAFIVAGTMLVFSVDEGMKDRAKKAIFTTVIALILVLVSYTLLNFTISVTGA